MNKRPHFIALWLVVAVLAGCQGLQQAPSLGESIAAGYITVETLAESALMASEAGRIDTDDRAKIKSMLQQAKDGLDTALELLLAGRRNDVVSQLSIAYGYFETVRGLLEDSQ